MTEDLKTIVNILQRRAITHADKKIFTFLTGEAQPTGFLTYQSLDERCRTIASVLQKRQLKGERALLFFPQGLAFITAFFGCLYAGVIAVPSYPPGRNKMNRLRGILKDSEAQIILSNRTTYTKSQKIAADFFEREWLLLEDLSNENFENDSSILPSDIAYLQYTSGSTGNPKGVMISHSNIIHNSVFFKEVYQLSEQDCCVSWAPLFHDMGLVDGLFSPIFANYPLYLMSPYDFIQKPLRWLKAIEKYQATKAGGPNFAYDLCVEKISEAAIDTLNLSQVKCFFNGAEHIWKSTLDNFYQKFARTGLRKSIFNPGYGMAETTLQVTGVALDKPPKTLKLDKSAIEVNKVIIVENDQEGVYHVSNGYPRLGLSIKIVNPATLNSAATNEIGEIWVKGGSVAQGYWQNPTATAATFQQTIKDTQETGYLRTGDLGFLHQGELYITGRIKDLLIVRGRNYYPQDIEKVVQTADKTLQSGSTIAFSTLSNNQEKIIVVQEVKRTFFRRLDTKKVMTAIRSKIAAALEIEINHIILVRPMSIPKTSSGKLMRQACKKQYLEQELSIIDQSILTKSESVQEEVSNIKINDIVTEKDLQQLLIQLVAQKTKVSIKDISKETSIFDLGLDSIKVVEIGATLEKVIHQKIDPSLFWEFKTIELIAQFIFQQKLNQ